MSSPTSARTKQFSTTFHVVAGWILAKIQFVEGIIVTALFGMRCALLLLKSEDDHWMKLHSDKNVSVRTYLFKLYCSWTWTGVLIKHVWTHMSQASLLYLHLSVQKLLGVWVTMHFWGFCNVRHKYYAPIICLIGHVSNMDHAWDGDFKELYCVIVCSRKLW